MNIPKFLEDMSIISKLGDNPGADNGLTTSAFRAKFDEAGHAIQNYINNTLIPAINPSVNPESGLSMAGPINMNKKALTGLKTPTSDEDAVSLGYTKEKLQTKHKSVQVVLPSNGWANLKQTVSVDGATADNDVIVTHTKESKTALSESGVDVDSQGRGTLTFVCEQIPTVDLTVNVMILD